MEPPQKYCQLILAVNASNCDEPKLRSAISGGDVASVIFYGSDTSRQKFMSLCCEVVPIVQAKGIAALTANDTEVMDRSGADGLYVDEQLSTAKEWVARFSPQKIVGFGSVFNRHDALTVGEAGPDFLLFGKLGGDTHAEPHPKNVELANWWSGLVEIPCIVMGGNVVDSIGECAASGAEFVALERAVFEGKDEPQSKVAEANRLLEMISESNG